MPMSEESIEDAELLRLAAGGSREALAEVARRYVGFVYAAALRQVRDAHLAEDVTQAVFVILAQKVARLKPGTLLAAWLFTTTRYAAANATKLQRRRQFHERRAAAMRELEPQTSSPSTGHVAAHLDEALAELRATDRSAILLSYLAGKSWREVADALGTTEEAARKRVSRAVAQLRGIFARRGVVTTGAAIVAAMTASTQASVPPALMGSVTAVLTTGTLSTAGTSSLIVKGAIQMMSWAQIKIAAAIGTAVMLGTLGAAGAMVMHQQAGKTTAGGAAGGAPAPAVVPTEIKHGAYTATLENGVSVELVAVSKKGDKASGWWNADGAPSQQTFNDSTSQDDPPHTHQVVVHLTGGQEPSANYVVPGAQGWSAQPASQGGAEIQGMKIVTFSPKGRDGAFDLTVMVASGDWETRSSKADADGITITVAPEGTIAWGQTIDENGRTVVTVSDTLKGAQRRIVAVDHNGNEHDASEKSVGAGGDLNLHALKFDLPLDQVAEIRFNVRPYDQLVTFHNVSLVAGKKTEPKVEVKGK
jgi:RNA polymerase sigma factor (sigma-70 family)